MDATDILRRSLPALSVLAVFIAALAAPKVSAAEDYLAAQTYYHGFNNNVTVYTGLFALNKDMNLRTSAYAKYTVDFINPKFGDDHKGKDDDSANKGTTRATSSASTAVSSSNGGGRDTRRDITAGITHDFGGVIGVEAYVDYSKEKDYISRTPTLTLKKDLFDKNTTVTLGYSRNIDGINGQFMTERAKRNTNNYFAGITQVLTPTDLAQIGYSRSESRGFGSEGIRLVPLNGVAASTCTGRSATCAQEAHPDTRYRNSYLLGYNHYFLNPFTGILDRSSLKLRYRYYNDSWRIRSHTGEAEFSKYLSEPLIMRLDYRYYAQTAAFFSRGAYTAADIYKTASPQLGAFNTSLAGIKFKYIFKTAHAGPLSGWFQGGSVEAKYEFYAESIGVDAHVFMAGLRLLL